MSETLITRDHGGGVMELQLNRAPVNALTPDFLHAFGAKMDELGTDDAVRSVLISSAFKVFSAGMDLKEAVDFDLDQQNAVVDGLNQGFLSLYACPKPVVACVNGAAIAGGLFFLLGADQRIVSQRAALGLAEVRVGVDFPIGPMEIARAELSAPALRRLMLTGQPMRADDALANGVADQVTDGDPFDAALAKATELAALPMAAYAAIKQQIRAEVCAKIRAGSAPSTTGWFKPDTPDSMKKMLG